MSSPMTCHLFSFSEVSWFFFLFSSCEEQLLDLSSFKKRTWYSSSWSSVSFFNYADRKAIQRMDPVQYQSPSVWVLNCTAVTQFIRISCQHRVEPLNFLTHIPLVTHQFIYYWIDFKSNYFYMCYLVSWSVSHFYKVWQWLINR